MRAIGARSDHIAEFEQALSQKGLHAAGVRLHGTQRGTRRIGDVQHGEREGDARGLRERAIARITIGQRQLAGAGDMLQAVLRAVVDPDLVAPASAMNRRDPRWSRQTKAGSTGHLRPESVVPSTGCPDLPLPTSVEDIAVDKADTAQRIVAGIADEHRVAAERQPAWTSQCARTTRTVDEIRPYGSRSAAVRGLRASIRESRGGRCRPRT